jgi:hypothetical protein
MRKMKDMRGAHVSAVRNAISKKFRLQLISNRHKNSREILDWKQSKEVKDSYNKLFTEEIAIEEITTFAFPSLTNVDNDKFNDIYIYTASVYDIILNPNCPTLEVSKAAMELRLKKFRVSIDFILLFKKLNLLNKFKFRTYLMKKVKLSLAIQRLKKRLTFLAKINLPMIMKMKRGKTKTNLILILNRMMACLINSGNYFDLFYF